MRCSGAPARVNSRTFRWASKNTAPHICHQFGIIGATGFPSERLRCTLQGVSKAFTREDDAAGPELDSAPPRLAPGEVRYVTPEGFRALQRELDLVDPSSRRANALAATLPLLTVHAPRCEGRAVFGCWVVLRDESGAETSWRIVGPDEADAKERRLSIASPLARELLGKEAGDFVSVELPRGTAEFEVLAVAPDDPALR